MQLLNIFMQLKQFYKYAKYSCVAYEYGLILTTITWESNIMFHTLQMRPKFVKLIKKCLFNSELIEPTLFCAAAQEQSPADYWYV